MIISCASCGIQYDVRAFAEGTVIQCRCRAQLVVPAHLVAAVRCPGCGGTVDATAQRCQYCQSLVSRRRCPQCGAGLREESRFCDQCGATIDELGPAHAQASERSCPRCQVPLFHDSCAGEPVEACAECLGMWVTHQVVQGMAAGTTRHIARVSPSAASSGAAAAPQPAVGPAPGAAAYIPCPSCGQIMNPKNYGGQTGIMIDFCALHGVWFDANELNHMLEAVAREGGATPMGSPVAVQIDPDAAEETRRRVHQQTLESIERQREESLGAVVGDAGLEVVDWVRSRVRKLMKGKVGK